ncbi:MAG: hypothetical protein HQL90_00475 [Magnetococcales bacterium]|nr:hypothetical protein [Magnetococcales bacterium]
MSIRKTATLLNHLDPRHALKLLAYVDERDEKLARQLRDEMFLFIDLLRVDERGLQHLLRVVEQSVLIMALKGADWPLLEKILDNLSPRAAETVREELAALGPVKARQVQAARQTVMQTAQQLQSRGLLWFVDQGCNKDYIY